MKGLTPTERDMLQRCTVPYEDQGGTSDPVAIALCDRLVAQGRLRLVEVSPGRSIYQATYLGRKALTLAVVKVEP